MFYRVIALLSVLSLALFFDRVLPVTILVTMRAQESPVLC